MFSPCPFHVFSLFSCLSFFPSLFHSLSLRCEVFPFNPARDPASTVNSPISGVLNGLGRKFISGESRACSRGAGSAVKLVEPTCRRSGDVNHPAGSRVEPMVEVWGTKPPQSKDLKKLRFFMVMPA